MRKLYLFAAMAAMLAACSENDLSKEQAAVQQTAEEGAVLFDVYMQRTTTRAGWVGSVNTAGLKDLSDGALGESGFGVFGYYTNSSTYDQQATPNFFYNQQVKWNTNGYFEYAPVKYWPNEYGTTAQSEDADKVSFFAYAPYIDVVAATGKPTEDGATPEQTAELQKWGISSLTRNNATGDPMVKYIASFDQDKSVDLCWGVCDDTDWRIIQTGGIQGDLNKGLPWLNVQRPAEATVLGAAGQKLKFTFKHATAQLKVNINAYVDGLDNTQSIASGTKVYVRSITFEGLATKGTLNLNNTEAGANKAYWLDYNGTNDLTTGESVTIYDGRKDGKEGTPSGIATNEKALGLNPDLVQSDVWANSAEGVTKELKNLFRKYNETTKKYEAASLPIYVIPTGDPVKVTITYDIETADENLATYVSDVQQHGSSVENVITKEIDFGGTTVLGNGKSYVINLHLGMNSVKFDAAVTDWVDAGEANVDLPYNAPVASAIATDAGSHTTITIPAAGAKGIFQVSGLAEGAAITATYGTVTGDPSDPVLKRATVGADGMAEATYNITANNTITDIVGTLTVSDGSKSAILDITQKAHALDLGTPTINPAGKEITLPFGASAMTTDDWNAITGTGGTKVTKKANGAEIDLTYQASGDPGATEYTISGSGLSATITLGTEVAAGDVYTITVTPTGTDKAAAETVTLKIGGITFESSPYSIEFGDQGFKPTPTVIGATPTGYSYSVTSPTYADVTTSGDNAGEVITLTAGGSDVITVTAIGQTGEGYQYTTNSVKATYAVAVTKAIGTLSYNIKNKPEQTVTSGDEVYDNIKTATQTNSHGYTLDKSVSYTIISVNGITDVVEIAKLFTISGTALKVGSTNLAKGTTYTVQIRASVTNDTDVEFTNNSQTATFTVTTVAP